MGSGKSKVARRLAEQLKVELISTDALIEAKAGKSINEIFRLHGEAYFRNLESEIIKEVSLRQGVIIDCGGGVVLHDENLKNLKTNGNVFFLEATPEIIYKRIKNEKHRPLLNVPDP